MTADSAPVLVPVEGASARSRFLKLTRTLYRADPCWVEPLAIERRQHLDPRHNPYFAHAEVAYWLAERNGETVGRISAQIDRHENEGDSNGIGHFGFLDAIDDRGVFALLLGAAEDWLRRRGMRRITGPFTLSINDESGLLIDGFDTPPFVMMGHAPAYAAGHVAGLGYEREKDLIAYLYRLDQPLPPSLAAFLAKISQSASLTFRSLDWRNFDAEIARVVAIFNDAWAGNWGFVPFDRDGVRHLAKALRMLIGPDDVAIGEIDGLPVAMAVGLPNINEAIADLDGRLLPFGWAKLLWRLKIGTLKSARMPLMGVSRKYHNTPAGAALAIGVIDRLRQFHRSKGTLRAELSWILEDNRPMRRMIEAFGAVAYKTYRVFGKDLT